MKNSFEALCELAEKEDWCWTIACTTCGHTHFRYAFQEIARGKSPADEDWIVRNEIKDFKESIGRFPRRFEIKEKIKVLEICLEANITDPRIHLGYLGLVLHHMGSKPIDYQYFYERRGDFKDMVERSPLFKARSLYEELSRKWAKDMLSTVNRKSGFWSEDREIHFNVSTSASNRLVDIIESEHEVLTPKDLEIVEHDWFNQQYY